MTPTAHIAGKFLKTLNYIIVLTGAVVFLYALTALLFSILPTQPPEHNCRKEAILFLNTNGVHVDFIIPWDYLPADFAHELEILPGARFVAFGWGDRNFYINTPQWSDLTVSVAFKALFLKSPSALHVTFYQWQEDNWFALEICNQQLEQLIVYIENTFIKDKSGRLVRMEFEGYHENDVFFEAQGSFSLFNTCNAWVNRGLKTIEVKTAVWTPFDFGVLYHVK